MLVISRKRNQSIIITHGDARIVVKFFGYDKCKGRIGVEAPADVIVYRSELEQSSQK